MSQHQSNGSSSNSPTPCYNPGAGVQLGKCQISYQVECGALPSPLSGYGVSVQLFFDNDVHHVSINNNGVIDNTMYVPWASMTTPYTVQATQTGSNPTTWGTIAWQWICGSWAQEQVWDGSGDPMPWHQDCFTSVSILPYDAVYIYYKGGRDYIPIDIQTQYWGIMAWLENQGWVDPTSGTYTAQAGDVYHTIIGGGGERWLDWATSAYTGVLNNAGLQMNWSGGPNQYNGDCDTNGWDEYGTAYAAGALGDIIDWSHNTGGVYDFYCSTDAGLSTSGTNSGNTITSLGLPPTASAGDDVLIIILNDDSECCYHGSKSTANATINGVTYQGCIDFDGGCGPSGGDVIYDGAMNVWKADHNFHTTTLTSHIGTGGNHSGVNWPTMPAGDMSQPKDLSYILHVAACITTGNGVMPDGKFTAGCPKYHPTISNGMWDPTGLPTFNMPPGATSDGYPCIRVLENSNPYVTNGSGLLEQWGWTYPKLFGGSEFTIYASPGTITQPGLPGGTYVIPPFEIQLQETLEVDFSIGGSGSGCSTATDCITVIARDIGTSTPVAGIDIDFGALGIQTTNASGYAYFNNVIPGTYYMFGDTANGFTTTGQCYEYLLGIQVGSCQVTPDMDCACGCDDPSATNYDATADYYDPNECPCLYNTYGCTDPTACNYDAAANIDDGSCCYPGCMDPTAPNYDASACCDDGSCQPSVPPCDIAYGENDPAEHLTDVDIKRIEIEALFADDVYKHFQAMRFGMTSPCINTIDKRTAEKYLCYWEDKKEKEYTGLTFEREVFKPEEPGTLPEVGTYPSWVDPLCGLTEKGELTVYFFYDATSLGVQQIKDINAATELWIQTLTGQGFKGDHYHTVVAGERWIDWASTAITGQFNNAGKNCTPAGTQSTNPACIGASEASCRGGCYAASEFATGECGCHQSGAYNAGMSVRIQDWAQNGNCNTKFYDTAVAGTTCDLWVAANYTPIGTSVTWNGPPPACSTEQVLVICFADECETALNKVNFDPDFMCYHENGSLGGGAGDWNIATVGGSPSASYKADYDFYLQTYNDFTSRSCNHEMYCFLYPSMPATVWSPHKPFPLHALGAISSGNKATPDGTWNAGTAPTNAISPMTAAEISNPYWTEPNPNNLVSGYGGLDRFGWGVNVAQVAFTPTIFTNDLNEFFDLNLYQCDDNECLVFDVVNQDGNPIEDYQIYLDGKDVGKTNEIGRYTHIIPKASVNTDHTVQICECFKTSGDCAQQRIKITATELCPDSTCTAPDPQCTCNAPGNLQVTSLTYNSVILNWSATTTTETSVRYDIRYRIVNTTTPNTWIEVNDVTNTYLSLTGLTAETKYEFQVRGECLDADGIVKKTSDWNALQQFTTAGVCPEIESLLAICDNATTYKLGWQLTALNTLDIATSNGTWGIIWGTDANITYTGGTPTGGGITTTTMVPGNAATYPASGVIDTIITENATGLAGTTTYYWRAYINMTGCPVIQSEIKSFSTA